MMKHLLAVVGLGIVATVGAQAQAVDVSACDLMGHPMQYDGKIVRVKGTVQASFDTFLLLGDGCSGGLWLAYPAGTKAKSGPATVITLELAANATATPAKARPALTLARSKDFEAFDTLLTQKVKTPGMCLACVKNDVEATLTGRLDWTADPGLKLDSAGKVIALDGFGNLNQYSARLVITGVEAVAAKEVDFKSAPKVKDDNPGGNDKDYMTLTRKAADAFPKGDASAKLIQRAVGAYGAQGEDNGVLISFGSAAEILPTEGAKGPKPEPGGLVVNVRFDPDRLKGDALSRALAHQGAEVADLREKPTASLGTVEQDGWQATLLVTIGSRQKTLLLPGGTVLWDESWPAPERPTRASAAISHFLSAHEQISR